MRKISLAALFLALALLPSSRARAQAGGGFGSMYVSSQASGSAAEHTPGVKLGETFLMHAALSVGAGVDSNVFYEDRGATSSAMLRVLQSVILSNSGRGSNPDIGFSLNANGDYRHYFSDNIGVA